MLVGDSLVVEAQQMQDCCMEIANLQRVFDDVVQEVVRLAIDCSAFYSAASHPHAKAARVMIAASNSGLNKRQIASSFA